MEEPSQELEALIEQLKQGKISKEEFERRSAELVNSIGGESQSVDSDSVGRERIRAAAKMARKL